MQKRYFIKGEKKKYQKLLEWTNISDILEKRISFEKNSSSKIINFIDNDEKISISVYTLYPLITYDSSFLKSEIKGYISLKNNKLYYSNPEYIIHFILRCRPLKKRLNLDWCKSNFKFEKVDKLICKNILQGKISSKREYTKNIYRGIVNKNQNVPYKLIEETDLSYYQLKSYIKVAKNYENLIKNRHKLKFDFMSDFRNEAFLLQEKINFNWSEKRMKEVHSNWSKKIADIKFKSLEDEMIEYSSSINLPYIRIINSKKELYLEGKQLSHCVFNYWEYIKDKVGLICSFKKGNDRGTIYIEKIQNVAVIRQFYGYKNKPMSENNWSILNNYIENELGQFVLEELKLIN